MVEAAELTKHDNYCFQKSMHAPPNTTFDFDPNRKEKIQTYGLICLWFHFTSAAGLRRLNQIQNMRFSFYSELREL